VAAVNRKSASAPMIKLRLLCIAIPFQIDKTLDEPPQSETDRDTAQMGFESIFDGRSGRKDADGDESAGDGHVPDEAFVVW